MKKLLLKNLLAFIITIFSVSVLQAQQCKGPNKILVCQCARYSDFICYYVCKCIRVSQLKEHLGNGWTLSMEATAGNTTSSNLPSVSVTNSNAISITLARQQNVSLRIYDITGRLIKTLADKNILTGEHSIAWNKKDEMRNALSPGIYVVQFDAGVYKVTKKLTVIK